MDPQIILDCIRIMDRQEALLRRVLIAEQTPEVYAKLVNDIKKELGESE